METRYAPIISARDKASVPAGYQLVSGEPIPNHRKQSSLYAKYKPIFARLPILPLRQVNWEEWYNRHVKQAIEEAWLRTLHFPYESLYFYFYPGLENEVYDLYPEAPIKKTRKKRSR